MKRSEIFFGLLRIPFDFGLALLAWTTAYQIRPYTDLIPFYHFPYFQSQLPAFQTFFQIALISSLGLIFLFALAGLYSLKTTFKKTTEITRIASLVFTWIMFFMAYYFLIAHELFFSRIVLLHTAFFAIIFISLGRILIRFLQNIGLKFGIGKRNVLLAGTNATAQSLANSLDKNPAYNVIGTLKISASSKYCNVLLVGSLNDLIRVTKKYRIDEIWLTENLAEEERILLEFCQTHQIGFRLVPDIQGLHFSHVEIAFFNELPVLAVKPTSLDGWGKVIKRAYDLLSAIIGLILLAPFFLLIGLMVKLDSPGPIFYHSKRVGIKGQKFLMLKFRSMRQNAEKEKAKLQQLNHRKGPLFKIKNDPRVTRLGKFLRQTSLDELPQLWNVLKGEMSLVGPRPHLPEEVKQYQEYQKRALTLKPGITGLAQISGRSDLDFEKEIKLDIAYMENWSLWLDIKIIIKTIFVILGGKGAD